MQLSPEGEVNSGVDISRLEASRYISSAVHLSEGDSRFSIYQISGIKMKKSNFFVNLKRHLEGSFFTIYKHFGDFSSAFLRFCCKFSKKIVFYLPVNTDRLTLVAFLVFVWTTASFISQISSSENLSKRDAILPSVVKQWIAKDIPSYGTRKNCYSLIW